MTTFLFYLCLMAAIFAALGIIEWFLEMFVFWRVN